MQTRDNTHAVQLRGVVKTYRQGRATVSVLRDVSFTIARGSFVTITGPSGSGKSTLLKVIGGLLSCDTGEITVFDQHVHAMRDRVLSYYRNHVIGIVFQDYQLIPHQSALENVMLPLKIAGLKRSEQRKRAVIALRSVGMEKFLDIPPSELSGGQQQRVSIARSIVTRPRLLLADEPTGNLDTKTGAEIMTLLKNIQQKLDTTIIMVTHNPELARMSDANIHIVDGVITQEASA